MIWVRDRPPRTDPQHRPPALGRDRHTNTRWERGKYGQLKRKLQKQESYRRTNPRKYKHEFLDYIYKGLMRYTFDPAAVKYIEESSWGHYTRLKALMSLTDFAKRDFVELKYNAKDTRCWNEFVGMKSELRRFFRHGDLHYRYVIDIRSCHPLFLADYLINHSVDRSVSMAAQGNPVPTYGAIPSKSISPERERSERLSITHSTTITQPTTSTTIPSNSTTITSTTNPICHYDRGNSDIQAELTRWNALFSDPDTDPKAVLINELG